MVSGGGGSVTGGGSVIGGGVGSVVVPSPSPVPSAVVPASVVPVPPESFGGAVEVSSGGAVSVVSAGGASLGSVVGRWLVVDVLYKLAAGLLAGLAIGWLLGRLFFRARSETLRLANHAEGFTVLAATFLAYGVTELIGGYGFLAVFVCACSVRGSERSHGYHQVLHDFAEQVERLFTVGLLLLLGGAVVRGLLGPLTWGGVIVAVVLLLVIRPLAGRIGLLGSPGTAAEHRVIGFFGIRGIGSLYYLAYALDSESFEGADRLWAIAGLVVVLSVVLHGIAATPVMRRLDRARERTGDPGE